VTSALLFVTLGGALMFASIKCVKFLPLLAGQRISGDHCTGSLLALFSYFAFGWLQKLLGAAGLGALLRALGRGGGTAARPGAPVEPAPAEPAPQPELPAPPELPALPPAVIP
jgi:hypothetical protein